MPSIEPVIDGIRRKIQHWVVSDTPLISNAVKGTKNIYLRSARRFEPGDEILIKNNTGKAENNLIVDTVVSETLLTVRNNLNFDWTVNSQSSVLRTFGGKIVKNIYFGDPDIISLNELPAIAVDANNSNSEWFTTRTTKERYDINIIGYIAESNMEAGSRLLFRIMNQISKGLKRNLYPLSNDYKTSVLTSDVINGDLFIKVADTSVFNDRSILMLENDFYTQEFIIKCISDSTTVELSHPAYYDFNKSNTTVIIPNRFFFNSWPSSIDYGKIKKGTLLKAGVISYFCEEVEKQITTSYNDTQLR
jgi:hypothetical protein